MNPLEVDLTKLASASAGDRASADRHRESLRPAVLAAFDDARAVQPKTLQIPRSNHNLFAPKTWRTLMTHPASRVAAALMIAVAAIGIVWLLGGGSSNVAYADLVDPLLNAKTATFNISLRSNGKDVPVAKAFVNGSAMRMEMSKDGRSQIDITDAAKRQTLSLNPQTKQAMLIHTKGAPANGESAGMLEEVRKFLTPANDQPGTKRESLGEQQVDGQNLVGYRVTSPAMAVEIWGDPKTLLPNLLIQRMAAFPSAETRMSDFKFDVKLDPSLFSFDPPAGYKVTEQTIDVSPPTEQDLLTGLREYTKIFDGVFPDALNSEVAINASKKLQRTKNADAEER